MMSSPHPKHSAGQKAMRQALSWKAAARWLLFLGAVCLLARALALRNRPERLREVDGTYRIFWQGRIYSVDNNFSPGKSASILSLPVTGGPKRLLAQEDIDSAILGDPIATLTHLVYITYVRPRIATGGMGGGGSRSGSGPAKIFLGSFRAAPATGASPTGRKRRRIAFAPSRRRTTYRVRRVALSGGSPETLRAFPLPASPLLTGDSLMWLRPGLMEHTEVTEGNRTWIERVGHDALMVTSLTTGRTREIARGLAPGSLTPGREGVFWLQDRPFPDARKDLCYARPEDSKPQVFPDFQGSLPQYPPLEHGDRLHWFVGAVRTTATPDGRTLSLPWLPEQIVSARRDGSDQRIVLSLTERNLRGFGRLFSIQDSLLAVLSEPLDEQALEEGRAPRNRAFLCRLHPDRAEPLEIVRALPGQAQNYHADDRYLYFQQWEEQRGLWARLTDDPVNARSRVFLYRVPLTP